MKKLLASLSFFLLTNVSLAGPFSRDYIPPSPEQIRYMELVEKYEFITILIFGLMLFLSICLVIKNNRVLVKKEMTIKAQKKLENISILCLLLPFIMLIFLENIKLFVIERLM